MGRTQDHQSGERITVSWHCVLGTWCVPGVKSDLLLALSLPRWTLSRTPSHRSPRDMAWVPAQPLVGLLAPSTPLFSALGPCALPAWPEHTLTRGDTLTLTTLSIPRPVGKTEAERA